MKKTITKEAYAMRMLFWIAEAIFVAVAPVYEYGWIKGLMITSALSSLLHIAGILCGVFPVYKIKGMGEIKT